MVPQNDLEFDLKVEAIGQPIIALLGETEKQARAAAKCVKVTYKPLKPILTIQVICIASFLPSFSLEY